MMAEFGTGALQSPPDALDLVADPGVLAQLAKDRLSGATTLPDGYDVPRHPPTLNQGSTSQCVAYSSATEQQVNDRDDFGKWVDLDEARHFRDIGGIEGVGAYMRSSLERMRTTGYPEADATPRPDRHRIEAYFRVGQTSADDVKRAIIALRGVLVVGPWFDSWTNNLRIASPGPAGIAVIPQPSGSSSGHGWYACGYRQIGVRIHQSWGTAWGDNGHAIMPWSYVLGAMWEIWKAADLEVAEAVIRTGRIVSLGVNLRGRRVLDPDAELGPAPWGTTTKAGIRRNRDGKIVATPWDRAFRRHRIVHGARHGLQPYPRDWVPLMIDGEERYVARPLVRLGTR